MTWLPIKEVASKSLHDLYYCYRFNDLGYYTMHIY